MPNFTANQVGLSYPKGRELIYKIFAVNRTDSSAVKMVIPKDACIVDVKVYQAVAASTAAGAFDVGWSGSTQAILNAFSMPTTSVGFTSAGAAAGSGMFSKLTADRQILCTYTVGSSTAGGTGYVMIGYFMPGGQENVDD